MDLSQLEIVQSRTLRWLERTEFAPTYFNPLPGGTVNFTYLAHLKEALEDGTKDVVVKHSEDFVRHTPSFKVSITRILAERECLRTLSSSFYDTPQEGPKGSSPEKWFNYIVRTPKCLYFDEAAGMQIHEYMPNGVDLKTYTLEKLAYPRIPSLEPQCKQLGEAVGRWVRNFHDQASQRPMLIQEVTKNKEAQQVQQLINYQFAVDRLQQFPSILTEALPILEAVQKMAAMELTEEPLQVIHGDLGPANILLPDVEIQAETEIPVFVIDWETSQLGISNIDTGQMIADTYRLWLCKKIAAALWMLQGFCKGYGPVSEAYALRTAVHAGIHLIARGSIDDSMGTPEQLEEVARIGRDMVVNAFHKNRAWFEAGDLKCLFEHIERQ